ncbi:adenosylcobalamin-dependent ribonucleoside-diphosphate reductase, partial [Patescibacteria group bacterium]|nr:adenosylcobalamin-dependent ribonucleoside-diphosphate reductase [Patescibacteria group bacterium]
MEEQTQKSAQGGPALGGQKQKINELVPKEVEKINGYYKKVVLEPSYASQGSATEGKPSSATKEPTKLEGLALKVFNNRYSLKDEEGKQLEHTAEQMWRRVARTIAQEEMNDEQKESWEQEFYWALEDFKFVPGGRILTGAGARGDVTFYNCFVLPCPDDSRGGIMDSVKNMVEIMARGGGVGVNLSSLRPRGSYVKGVNGTASGAVSFGALYSFSTGLVTQGGARRGALMLMINDDHPDIEEFITVKRTMGQMTNANLSVAVSDAFMEALKTDKDWDLQWGGKVYKTVKAVYLWDLITESAHESGEPGVVFLERCGKEVNTWYFEDIVCVNPCGEQPLPAWGVCNLGSVNLVPFAKEGTIDWENLRKTVHVAIRFMDNVIDSTPYSFKENREVQMAVRRVGLGTMGLADFFIKLKVRYGSNESVKIARQVYEFIRNEAYRASIDIAKEKGSFPKFDKEKFLQATFVAALPEDIKEDIAENGIRNGVLLTQAPTGTTSMLANVSSGIEPVFDFAFKRIDRLGEHIVYHPLFKQWQDENPDQETPEYFVNAKQLTPLEHVQMQAVIQKYTDASISKTVNAPEGHTHNDVKELYVKAYELGCKGVTYYRENSRDVSVLESLDSAKKTDKKSEGKLMQEQSDIYIPPPIVTGESQKQKTDVVKEVVPRDRPEVMAGKTYRLNISYGKLYVTINDGHDGKPFEVFATIGKAGGFFAATSEAICRLASLALRAGVCAEEVIKQLKGIRGPMPSFNGGGQKILSLADAIAHILERHISGDQIQLDLGVPEEKKASHAWVSQSTQSIADNGHAPE